MSETMALPPLTDASAKKTPTVYFIDDSATMREVIKIAFRRENFNVITCGDAASALSQFDQNPPDAVITDVIMPDQDGYSVCTQVKQHEKFGHIPVVLMSGVVNKTVADKAVSVKADELIRKPFQPQELIGRVKALLYPKSASAPVTPVERAPLPGLVQPPAPSQAAPSLSSLFSPPQPVMPAQQPHAAQPISPNAGVQPPENAWPRALADAFTPPPVFATPPPQGFQPAPVPPAPAYPQQFSQPARPGFPNPNQQPAYPHNAPSTPPQQSRPVSPDLTKLRAEIARLDLQVKKLQTELQIERQYNQALEAQLHALTHSE
jgi:twitching motility two-component system response regulator PilH